MEINREIPVLFQKINQYEIEDTRFLKVKIWLMHTGENLNGSYFDKSVVEQAIPSLANTPILCYIEDNDDGDKDFSDHRMILVKEDNDIKLKYIGSAIGVIPETNNAQFEKRICDDGTEREFLTVEGLVWKKWDDPIDIFNRDIIKNQSMELSKDYSGEFNKDDKLFHFTSFKFFGACALGTEVLPAMRSSTIEAQFTNTNVFEEINSMMEKYKLFSLNINKNEQGGNEMEGTEQNFSLSAENLQKAIRNILSQRTVMVKDYWGDVYEEQEFYYRDRKDNFVIVVTNDYSNFFGIPFTENNDTVTLDFDNKVPFVSDWRPLQEGETATVFEKEELEAKFTALVEKSKEKAISEFSIKESEDYKGLETQFTELQDTNKTLTDKVLEYENTIEENNTKFSTIEEELNNLKQFKKQADDKEKQNKIDSLFSKFEKYMSDEIKELKEKAMELEFEQLETNLYTIVGKKIVENNTFSTAKEDGKSIIEMGLEQSFEDNSNAKPYDNILKKYVKKSEK